MSESDNYYRERIAQELAAAERSADPAISQIHREMARHYSDKLDAQSDPRADDAGVTSSKAAESSEIDQTLG